MYAIDIVVSSGEGKPKVLDEKETTVYKRALDVQYQLKMKVRGTRRVPGYCIVWGGGAGLLLTMVHMQ